MNKADFMMMNEMKKIKTICQQGEVVYAHLLASSFGYPCRYVGFSQYNNEEK